jgi:8-oxoguanine deaminase
LIGLLKISTKKQDCKMSSILIENPLQACRMRTDYGNGENLLDSFQGGHIYIEDGRIISVGPEKSNFTADIVIDGSRMLVLPGLINTHHHFFQSLTRNVTGTTKAELFQWLTTNYEIWKALTEDAFYISGKLAMAELLKSGCTCSSDHLYLFPNQAGTQLIDAEIRAAAELGIRFQPTRGSMSLSKKDGGLPPDSVTQSEKQILEDELRLIQKYHNPEAGAMIRISLAPCSPFSVTPELMLETARISKEKGVQIHTHLAETLDEEQFCLEKFGQRPFEYMEKLEWIASNAWFAHSIHLTDAEIARGAKAGIGISHCPSSNMRLGSGIAKIKEMLQAGVKVSLGVDGSASNDSGNLLLESRNAMLLSRLRRPEYWLDAPDVLWMATVGGAKALGRNDIGQLLPGKSADLILISMDRLEYSGASHDPASAIVFSAALEPVDISIINGKIVVENGNIIGLDERELIASHTNISNKLLKF